LGSKVVAETMEKENLTELKIDLGSDMEAFYLFGESDENLNLLEKGLGVRIVARGDETTVIGTKQKVLCAEKVLKELRLLAKSEIVVTPASINYALAMVEKIAANEDNNGVSFGQLSQTIFTTPKGKHIKAKTLGQKKYLEAIASHDIVFGIGPAGTGKTYLAVVCAVMAWKKREVGKIVLVRPAVEAGEKLGFLPGDLQEKVNPYLRPVYDALDDVLGADTAAKLIERNVIEVVPLAYMRGRTLEEAFIILDEAQNTTKQQMKMFLTRMGTGSKSVITGDITQIDLPKGQFSGLKHAEKILQPIKEIAFCYLTQLDVVRHPLVQKIIEAYEKQESLNKKIDYVSED
jgi:phosphate starvation-inducible PhoH-like protein